MLKYLYGSKMLKLNNNRDEDWLTFTTECAKVANGTGCKSIPFFKVIINHFTSGKTINTNVYNARYLYQVSVGFHDDADYPFNDFNILEHKEIWIKWLKAYMNDKKTEEWALSSDILPKQFYHILYQYNMIIEDVHFISDEAKADVQKIHDYEMPKEYFYELRDKINNL